MAAADVDAYLAGLPEQARPRVARIRALVGELVPGVSEKISYGIPAFVRDGRAFAYTAGYAKHVSIHPVPDDHELAEALAPYRSGRGTCRFPSTEPLPEDLIRSMIIALARRSES